MKRNLKADLHMHSTASDGSYTPKELVAMIYRAQVELFALTDHDSTKNLKAMAEEASKLEINFLPGVEISSTFKGNLFHILAYGIDIENEELQKLLSSNSSLMEKKDDDSIRLLIKEGFTIDYEDYKAYEHIPSRGGWKTLNYLIDKGLCTDVGDFFGRIFNKGRVVPFPEFSHPSKVIEVVRRAGGAAILAHPVYDKVIDNLEENLEHFNDFGIAGIECYHPHHNEEAVKRCLSYAKANKLMITGGSDFHGVLIPSRKIGYPIIYTDALKIEGLEDRILAH